MKLLKLASLVTISFLTLTACTFTEIIEPGADGSAPSVSGSITTSEQVPKWTLVSDYNCRIEVSNHVGFEDPDIIKISTDTYTSTFWDDGDLYRTQGLVNVPDETGAVVAHSFQCIFIPLPDELQLWRFMFEPGEQQWAS